MVRKFLQSKPHLYDLAKRVYRFGPRTEAYKFFDTFSRSHNRQVTFVQIGASDGLRCDPIREFIVRDRWEGCLVEPLPTAFALLRENYSYLRRPELIFVNAAVSSSSGSLSFWTVDESFLKQRNLDDRISYLQKSSFEKEHVLRWIRGNNDPEDILREIKVPCVTLSGIVTNYLRSKPVDLLVIDAETHEASILLSVDFSLHKPTAIFYESHNLGPMKRALEGFLSRNQYEVSDLAGDSVAISLENGVG